MQKMLKGQTAREVVCLGWKWSGYGRESNLTLSDVTMLLNCKGRVVAQWQYHLVSLAADHKFSPQYLQLLYR